MEGQLPWTLPTPPQQLWPGTPSTQSMGIDSPVAIRRGGDLRELPRVPLRGEGSCGGGGAPRDSAGQEEKGVTEDEMAGWHHRLDGRESE